MIIIVTNNICADQTILVLVVDTMNNHEAHMTNSLVLPILMILVLLRQQQKHVLVEMNLGSFMTILVFVVMILVDIQKNHVRIEMICVDITLMLGAVLTRIDRIMETVVVLIILIITTTTLATLGNMMILVDPHDHMIFYIST
jgi:hypothetical protein